RVWFIDPATRMNPHYEYAQAVMGRNNGRGAGLIDARRFIQIANAAGLLTGAMAWPRRDQQAIAGWYRAFAQWMQTSANGQDEAAARNNHGSWYAAALAAFALFTGDTALARKTIEGVKARIAWQIEPDGRQPLETARTRGISYSVFNLEALCSVAAMGDQLGVDLWNYKTSDGRGMGRALAYLAPFVLGERAWADKQITQWSPEEYWTLLRRVAARSRDRGLQALLAKAPIPDKTERSRLLY
ncbi:MAG: alginate lyase family protein, partial [Blastocatellia bacterium]